MRTPPFQQRLKNYTLGSGRLPLSILLSSREDSEGNFCFATLGSHVSRPPGKPPRPLPPAFHHFLPPGGHHHLQHWSSSHEITKSQQLSSSPSLHQPHTPAPAGSVGQLVPPEQMVRNAGSSKERRRGAFIMRIQLNPGNGQCGEERGHQMQTKPVAVAEENASNLWSTRSTQSREPRYGWDLENWVDELVGQSLESIQVTPLRTKLFCGIGEGVIPKYPLLGFCKPSLRWPGTANKPICYQLGQSVKNGPI